MDLICYLHPGWAPLIRPAPATRAWMDDTPEAFAYRCLPLNIANAHGWEILSPCAFDAVWNGGGDPLAVTITPEPGAKAERLPVSLFGQGIVTFHIEGIFRTPPGWNLWISGSPNSGKDGIYPLTGVVETDWSPYTFTMNWRFSRPGQRVHFDALEPICFLFPVQRAALEAFRPSLAPIEADPELKARFQGWSRARDAFHRQMAETPPQSPSDKWQKHYYKGVDVAGTQLVADHLTKLRLPPFAPASVAVEPPRAVAAAEHRPEPEPAAPANARLTRDLNRRDWLLRAQQRQRMLSSPQIERRSGLGSAEFLDRYYAPGRPVILTGELRDWPALERWTPDYLKATVGDRTVEFQDRRSDGLDCERDKARYRTTAPFTQFVDRIMRPGAHNDTYMTAYNCAANAAALAPLEVDLGFPDKFLRRDADFPNGMMWIGPAGTTTALHHDLTNNFIAQVVGRKRFRLLPASDVGRLYNDRHVFSEITDLDDPQFSETHFPELRGATLFDVTLDAGEILFIPLAWWHQVKSLTFSVTLTYINFLWPNDDYEDFPADP